jgi:hypothetical protein
MVLDVVAVAAAIGVAGATGVIRHRVKRSNSRDVLQPTAPRSESSAWRLLGSPDELAEAIERAIACEQAAIGLSEHRAKRFAALRTQPAPSTPMPHSCHELPVRRGRPKPVPQAS